MLLVRHPLQLLALPNRVITFVGTFSLPSFLVLNPGLNLVVRFGSSIGLQ
jgi:hypothetical protein